MIRFGKKTQDTSSAGLAGWILSAVSGWKSRRKTSASSLHVIEKLSLGPKKALILVEVYGQKFLVASAGDSIPAMIALGSSCGSMPVEPEGMTGCTATSPLSRMLLGRMDLPGGKKAC